MTEHPPEQTEPADDGVEITGTGLVHLRLDGVDFWLRRPKIGEMKRLEEQVVAAAELQTDRIRRLAERVEEAVEASEGTEAAGGDESDAQAAEMAPEVLAEVVSAAEQAEDEMQAIVTALLACWREIVRVLERDRQTLPDDDDELPPWLANFDLIGEVRKAWRRLPWLAAPLK